MRPFLSHRRRDPRNPLRCIFLVLLLGLAGRGVEAQLVPAGGPWLLDRTGTPPSPWATMLLLARRDGDFLAIWQTGAGPDHRIVARRFDAAGPTGSVLDLGRATLQDAAIAPDGTILAVGDGVVRRLSLEGHQPAHSWPYDDGRVEPGMIRCGGSSCMGGISDAAALAIDPSGTVLVAWPIAMRSRDPLSGVFQVGQLLVRRFTPDGHPLGPSRPVAGGYAIWKPQVAAAGEGVFLVAAVRTDHDYSDFDDGLRIIVAGDTASTLASAPRAWEVRSAVAPAGRSLSVYTQTGWAWTSDDEDCTGVFGRLADAAGDVETGAIDLPRDRSDCQWQARVAILGDGFVTAWQTTHPAAWAPGPAANPFHGVSLRRFDREGRPLGDPLDLRLAASAFSAGADEPTLADLAAAGDRVGVLGAGKSGVWAALAAPLPPGPCRPGDDHLCLGGSAGDRFRVDLAHLDSRGDGRGIAHPLTSDTGAFWLFSPDNLEVLVKVLDGRALNGRFWVLAGAATTVAWWATVTDTTTDEQWGRAVDADRLATLADVDALPRPPALDPGPPLAPSAAFAGSAPEVELGGRYRLRVHWTDPRSGDSGNGRGVAATDDSALFWFFSASNVELLVKVLDGRRVNGHVWVLWGSLTDVGFELEVTDTVAGATRRYRNEPLHQGGGADTAAFE